MTFVKLVVLYDLIIGFLTIMYRCYLRGMSPKDKLLYQVKPTTKTVKVLRYLLLLAYVLSFVAALIFLIHAMFQVDLTEVQIYFTVFHSSEKKGENYGSCEKV